MKKQLLILTLGASFLLANSNEADLLSQVTKNSVSGTQYELSNQDMEKVDGGYTSFSSPVPQVFYGSIANQMQNLLEKSTQKTTTSTSISHSSNTTVKRMSNNIIKPNSSITYMRVSEFNRQFK
ncbi:MAG: hypothetical protein PHY49_07640 [Aliarcobacter skirrowii]|nr:hypothetical protein [Aliarcobacter skirrowii]